MQTMRRLWRCDNSVHQFGIVHLSITRRVNGAFSNPPMEARFTLRFASFNPQIADPVNSCVILHLNRINNQHWYTVLNLRISRWRDGWIHLSIFWAQALNIFSGAEQSLLQKKTLNQPNYLNLANGMHLHIYNGNKENRFLTHSHSYTYTSTYLLHPY